MNLATSAAGAGAVAASGKSRRGLRTILLLYATLYASLHATVALADATQRESLPQVWLNPGIYSQHFDSGKGLRNNNIGFGAEVLLASDHVLMAGSFINSNGARTHFGGYQWRPLHWKFSDFDVGAGVIVGAFDGYPKYRDGGWFIAPVPVLVIEGRRVGANISLIPTVANRFDGALAVQLKLRVW